MTIDFTNGLLGGALIGLAATLMLLFNGRVTGISGIINNAIDVPSQESIWRWSFLVGLIAGGAAVFQFTPERFQNLTQFGFLRLGIAGLLVGFGTIMGSGCTSGHGVCGISRLSVRSMLATVLFILAGAITVFLMKFISGDLP